MNIYNDLQCQKPQLRYEPVHNPRRDISQSHIEAKEPAFLRKLRGEHGGGEPARHERPIARPKKPTREGEEDDQPTYVMEDSQDTLSQVEYEALVKQSGRGQEGGTDLPSSTTEESRYKIAGSIDETDPNQGPPVKQCVAAIGGSTKRKLAKVVGDENDGVTKSEQEGFLQQPKQPKQMKTKKAKKAKLSFNEDAADGQ